MSRAHVTLRSVHRYTALMLQGNMSCNYVLLLAYGVDL
jgi:hypothetical protein